MKRLVLLMLACVALGGGVFAYYQYGGSPEVKRERYLKKGQEYIKQSKLNEAIIEFRNAVKADPRSADARHQLAQALVTKGDFRGAYGEFIRSLDLKPDFIKARFELAMLQLLAKNARDARQHLEMLRSQDRNAFETRYLAAQIALFDKAPEKALIELNEILKIDPKNVKIHIDVGQVYLSLKDFTRAEEEFRRVLESSPNDPVAHVALAQMFVAMGNQQKGEDELVLATKADPENEKLLHLLGLFYGVTRRFNEYENVYLGLLKKKPNSMIAKKRLAELYLAKEQYKQSREFTNAILQMQPNDTDGLFFRGRLNIAENNRQGAVEDLTLVTRSSPQFGPGFYFLGLAQKNLGRFDDAKKSLSRAVELNPTWITPRRVLAQLYLASGDADFALEQSEKILGTNSKDETALLTSGAAFFRKGDLRRALVRFKQAQDVNPQSIGALMDIGAIYLSEKKFSDALVTYEKVLSISPDFNDALNAIVTIYLVQGKSNEAFDRAEKQLAKTKNQASVYQMLGQIKLSRQDYSAAISFLSKAIELNPNLGSAYILIGAAYAAQRNFDSAIAEYEKIATKNPKFIPALMMLGILYDQKQQTQKANEYYQKILDINKEFYPAANNLAWNFVQHGGNLDLALGLAQKARETNPSDPTVADTLGWIQSMKGAHLTAIGLLKESNEKFKGRNPSVLYHLGMAYLKSGDKALAQDSLSKALALGMAFKGQDESKKALSDLKSK